MGKLLSVFLTVALAIASLGTLAYLESVRERSANAFGSPSAVSTVRAYYAAVNHYIATGEIEAVAEITGNDAIAAAGPEDPECAAPSLLPALRRTYPHMHITIDDLLRDGPNVVAQVSVEAGQAASFGSVTLSPLEKWRMTVIFTVAEGRVVSCAVFGPGQALMAAMHQMTSTIAKPGTLMIARVSFARDAPDYLSIPAPAIVSVEDGTLETPGDGVSVLTRVNGQQAETTEPGRNYLLIPGDELVISSGRIVLHNPEDKPASVLATTIVPQVEDMGEAEASSPVQRLFEGLTAPAGGEVGAGTWVRTLARSADLTGAGPIELMGASIVVTPGGSATIEDAKRDLLIIPLSGHPLIERNGPEVTIRNPDGDRVLIRIARAESSVRS